MKLGRMFWMTVIGVVTEGALTVACAAGAITADLAVSIGSLVALVVGSHTFGRSFEDAATKYKAAANGAVQEKQGD